MKRRSQKLLGAGKNIFQATIAADCETQRPRERFENRLDLMMRGAAVEAAQVNVGFGGLCEALKKIFQQFNSEIADFVRFYFCVDDAVRASAEINCRSGKSFIHRHKKISRA